MGPRRVRPLILPPLFEKKKTRRKVVDLQERGMSKINGGCGGVVGEVGGGWKVGCPITCLALNGHHARVLYPRRDVRTVQR